MAAVNDQKLGRKSPGSGFGYPMLAGVLIFGHTAVGLTAAGFAAPIQHADVIKFAGISEERIDNREGQDGDSTVETERGIWQWDVDGADVSNIGDDVYALDDNTLQLTNVGGAKRVGTIKTIDAEGVWIEF